MHVLVTGGAGYVGSQVTSRLLERGHHVRVLDAMLYGAESLLPFIGHENFSLQQGDVRNPVDVKKALAGVDTLVHLAAVVGEPACKAAPAFSWSTNHDAIVPLLEACRGHVQRVVMASTCSNYGVSAPDVEVDETAPLNPLSDYARAKVAVEKVVRESTAIPHATILRFATVCGIAGRMRFDLLVNEMARETVLGRTLQIFAPQAWRPYLHVHDAARAVTTVLETADKPSGQIYNVVAENKRKSDLLDIARAFDANVKHHIVEKQPDLRDYRVSGEHFKKTFGFACRYSIAEAFAEVAEAVRNGTFRDADEPRHTATAMNMARAA